MSRVGAQVEMAPEPTSIVALAGAPAGVWSLVDSRPRARLLRAVGEETRVAQALSPPPRAEVTAEAWAAGATASPEAGAWARRLSVAVVQCLLGLRHGSQLRHWVEAEVEDLVAARRISWMATTRRDLRAREVAVRSVHAQQVDGTEAEVAVHLLVGGRSLALAMRLRQSGDRWLCTALAVGPDPRLDLASPSGHSGTAARGQTTSED